MAFIPSYQHTRGYSRRGLGSLAWLMGREGLAYKISFRKMPPETGSMSSCRWQNRLHQPAHSSATGVQSFHGPERASPVPQDTLVRVMSLTVCSQGSGIPPPSESIPAGTACSPCSGAACPGSSHQPAAHPRLFSRLLPQPLGCPAPMLCLQERGRRTGADPCC